MKYNCSRTTFPQKTATGVQTYAFALSPSARAELSLKGEITHDDLELLRDHIELTIKALARTAKKSRSNERMAALLFQPPSNQFFKGKRHHYPCVQVFAWLGRLGELARDLA